MTMNRTLAVIAVCLVLLLATAYVVTHSLQIRNCFTPETPCLDLSGEQRNP